MDESPEYRRCAWCGEEVRVHEDHDCDEDGVVAEKTRFGKWLTDNSRRVPLVAWGPSHTKIAEMFAADETKWLSELCSKAADELTNLIGTGWFSKGVQDLRNELRRAVLDINPPEENDRA